MPGLAAAAPNPVLDEIVEQDAFAAVKVNARVLAELGNAAEVIGGAGAVWHDGQDLDAVGGADGPAHAALWIDPGSNMSVSLGQNADRRRRPAQERFMDDAQCQHVEAG